jgi:hypothetical protein
MTQNTNRTHAQMIAAGKIMAIAKGNTETINKAIDLVIRTGANAAAKRGTRGDVTAMMKFNSALKLLTAKSGLNPWGAIRNLAEASLTN